MIWVILLILLQSSAFSQKKSSFDKYKERSLSEIIELNREGTDQILRKAKIDEQHGFIGIDPFYSKARLQYVGTPRPISPTHQSLIKTWSKLQRVDKKFTSLYENEYLFKEGETEYWIPVQKPGSDRIEADLRSGEMVTLFVIYVGGQKEKNIEDFSSLFLSIAFEK